MNPLPIRSEPFRVFFPLGAALGMLGVGHWLAYVVGIQERYSGQAHALAQFQGFLMSFAVGFVLTMVPRRTGTPPAGAALIAVLAVGLVTTTVASLCQRVVLAEVSFLVVVLGLVSFGATRVRSAQWRELPPSFVLLPIGVLHAALGAALVAWDALASAGWANSVGRGLLQEGAFTCFVIGIGSFLLPAIRGAARSRSRVPAHQLVLLHAALGLAVLASFPLQRLLSEPLGRAAASSVGLGARAVLVGAAVLPSLLSARATRPGLHRRLAPLAMALVPVGFALAAAFPSKRVPLLHVSFIGGFTLLTLAVATHVVDAHAGGAVLGGEPFRSVIAWVTLLALAAAARVTADFFPTSYWGHVGVAAACAMASLAAWLAWAARACWSAGPTPPPATEPVTISMPTSRPRAPGGAS